MSKGELASFNVEVIQQIKQVILSARAHVVQTVNIGILQTYWQIG